MKGELLEDFEDYKKGQIIKIVTFEGVIFNYGVYRYDGLDLIPKSIVKIFDE